jgi:peptide/nickel transport system permease protein
MEIEQLLRFVARRLVNYVILVFVATSLAYLLASVALDPMAYYLHGQANINYGAIHASLRSYNIDPATNIWSRYWHWLTQILFHGNFGRSFPNGDTVTGEMGRRIGVSLRLLLVGSVLSVIIGVLVGVYSALHQYKPSDHIISVTSFVLLSTPIFLLATFVKAGAINLSQDFNIDWLPTANECPSTGGCGLVERGQHLILPTVVLVFGAAGAAFFTRYQRSAMLDVLGSDFLRTAQAKGLSRRKAFYKHGLRTALIPMATFFAFQFGTLLVGAVFTETIFNWNGMGAWTITTINNSDVNGIAAITGFAAVMILISGVLSDIFYAILDPRVRVN